MANIEKLLSLADPRLTDVETLPNGRMAGAIIINPIRLEEPVPNKSQEPWVATLAIACMGCPHLIHNGHTIENTPPGSGIKCRGLAIRLPVPFFNDRINDGQVQANLKATDGIPHASTHYCEFFNVSYDDSLQIKDLLQNAPCHTRVITNNKEV